MKQVVFAIALLAMASLTGCLNTEDSPVDENIDTTDDSTSDTTEDNSDTTEDTKEDELIEPVGGNGDTTIPEDSSVFMDSHGAFGEWDCTGDGKDRVCNYDFINDDAFKEYYNDDGTLSYVSYQDSDGIGNDINFNGWVNKTGNTVTIETLKYPDRGPTIYSEDRGNYIYNYYNYRYINQYVSSTCSNGQTCEIIFYGHNGLTFNAKFTLSSYTGWSYEEDTDGDGTYDSQHSRYQYAYNTPTFELPFEPYAFTITYNENSGVSRIF